jgi:hypothetical protein
VARVDLPRAVRVGRSARGAVMPMPLELTSPAPDRHLCTRCHIRWAHPHPLSGYYKCCHYCLVQQRRYMTETGPRRHYKPRKTSPRNEPPRSRAGYRQRYRVLVIELLGGICACPGCSIHPNDSCVVGRLPHTTHLLTVEHTKNDGAHHRRLRIRSPSGSILSSGNRAGAPWERYLRVIRANADHGFILLCHNCHHDSERKKRLNGGA